MCDNTNLDKLRGVREAVGKMPNGISEIIERLKGDVATEESAGLRVLLEDVSALIKAYEGLAQSNDLYQEAALRARALWKESHGEDPKWSPGADHLMVWMGEQLAAKDEKIEQLKGVIEVERLTLKSCLEAYDDARASLTTADALRGQLIKLGEKMGKCPFCGEAAGAWPLHIYETCPLVAFDTAHTFKENDHASSS